MTEERWRFLMDQETPGKEAVLSAEEMAEGWHWCGDFDDLLVGPGMGEIDLCRCPYFRDRFGKQLKQDNQKYKESDDE